MVRKTTSPRKHISSFKLRILLLLFSSCSIITEIDYRQNRKIEYLKECDYILSCEYDETNNLIVTVFTKKSWGGYYEYLQGINCNRSDLLIKSVNVSFTKTNDKLEPVKVSEKNQFHFTCKDLPNVLKRNKEIKIELTYSEKEKTTTVIYILQRHKKTYITGGKLLGC